MAHPLNEWYELREIPQPKTLASRDQVQKVLHEGEPIEARGAVLIGMTEFNAPNVANLPMPLRDVQMIEERFRLFGVDRITMLTSAQKSNKPYKASIFQAIADMRRAIGPQGLLTVVISTHGITDGRSLLLLPTDFEPATGANAIPLEELVGAICSAKGERGILIVDYSSHHVETQLSFPQVDVNAPVPLPPITPGFALMCSPPAIPSSYSAKFVAMIDELLERKLPVCPNSIFAIFLKHSLRWFGEPKKEMVLLTDRARVAPSGRYPLFNWDYVMGLSNARHVTCMANVSMALPHPGAPSPEARVVGQALKRAAPQLKIRPITDKLHHFVIRLQGGPPSRGPGGDKVYYRNELNAICTERGLPHAELNKAWFGCLLGSIPSRDFDVFREGLLATRSFGHSGTTESLPSIDYFGVFYRLEVTCAYKEYLLLDAVCRKQTPHPELQITVEEIGAPRPVEAQDAEAEVAVVPARGSQSSHHQMPSSPHIAPPRPTNPQGPMDQDSFRASHSTVSHRPDTPPAAGSRTGSASNASEASRREYTVTPHSMGGPGLPPQPPPAAPPPPPPAPSSHPGEHSKPSTPIGDQPWQVRQPGTPMSESEGSPMLTKVSTHPWSQSPIAGPSPSLPPTWQPPAQQPQQPSGNATTLRPSESWQADILRLQGALEHERAERMASSEAMMKKIAELERQMGGTARSLVPDMAMEGIQRQMQEMQDARIEAEKTVKDVRERLEGCQRRQLDIADKVLDMQRQMTSSPKSPRGVIQVTQEDWLEYQDQLKLMQIQLRDIQSSMPNRSADPLSKVLSSGKERRPGSPTPTAKGEFGDGVEKQLEHHRSQIVHTQEELRQVKEQVAELRSAGGVASTPRFATPADDTGLPSANDIRSLRSRVEALERVPARRGDVFADLTNRMPDSGKRHELHHDSDLIHAEGHYDQVTHHDLQALKADMMNLQHQLLEEGTEDIRMEVAHLKDDMLRARRAAASPISGHDDRVEALSAKMSRVEREVSLTGGETTALQTRIDTMQSVLDKVMGSLRGLQENGEIKRVYNDMMLEDIDSQLRSGGGREGSTVYTPGAAVHLPSGLRNAIQSMITGLLKGAKEQMESFTTGQVAHQREQLAALNAATAEQILQIQQKLGQIEQEQGAKDHLTAAKVDELESKLESTLTAHAQQLTANMQNIGAMEHSMQMVQNTLTAHANKLQTLDHNAETVHADLQGGHADLRARVDAINLSIAQSNLELDQKLMKDLTDALAKFTVVEQRVAHTETRLAEDGERMGRISDKIDGLQRHLQERIDDQGQRLFETERKVINALDEKVMIMRQIADTAEKGTLDLERKWHESEGHLKMQLRSALQQHVDGLEEVLKNVRRDMKAVEEKAGLMETVVSDIKTAHTLLDQKRQYTEKTVEALRNGFETYVHDGTVHIMQAQNEKLDELRNKLGLELDAFDARIKGMEEQRKMADDELAAALHKIQLALTQQASTHPGVEKLERAFADLEERCVRPALEKIARTTDVQRELDRQLQIQGQELDGIRGRIENMYDNLRSSAVEKGHAPPGVSMHDVERALDPLRERLREFQDRTATVEDRVRQGMQDIKAELQRQPPAVAPVAPSSTGSDQQTAAVVQRLQGQVENVQRQTDTMLRQVETIRDLSTEVDTLKRQVATLSSAPASAGDGGMSKADLLKIAELERKVAELDSALTKQNQANIDLVEEITDLRNGLDTLEAVVSSGGGTGSGGGGGGIDPDAFKKLEKEVNQMARDLSELKGWKRGKEGDSEQLDKNAAGLREVKKQVKELSREVELLKNLK
eukprot:Sspe_Gene.33681::Locus_16424_Transcript_1_1_Confidence_1.000_Length_5764::g.33681::m.33681